MGPKPSDQDSSIYMITLHGLTNLSVEVNGVPLVDVY